MLARKAAERAKVAAGRAASEGSGAAEDPVTAALEATADRQERRRRRQTVSGRPPQKIAVGPAGWSGLLELYILRRHDILLHDLAGGITVHVSKDNLGK